MYVRTYVCMYVGNMCRFLIPIDDRCLTPDELRGWEKGEQPAHTRVVEEGSFDPLLAAFVPLEKQFLLLDTINDLGSVRVAVCAPARFCGWVRLSL
jgi:hypothetical protein